MGDVVKELNHDITRDRFNEIESQIVPFLDRMEKELPKLIEVINKKREQLHKKSEYVYVLMTTLIERCNQLPAKFKPGIIKQIWYLGFRNPQKRLEKLVRFGRECPEFNHEQYEEYLKDAIKKTNIIGNMLEKAERQLMGYRGERRPDWPLLGKTFKEGVKDELEFYKLDMLEAYEALLPCTTLTEQWLALVECRNKV